MFFCVGDDVFFGGGGGFILFCFLKLVCYWIAQALLLEKLQHAYSLPFLSVFRVLCVLQNLFGKYATNILIFYHFQDMTKGFEFEVCIWGSKFAHLLGRGMFIDPQFLIKIVCAIFLEKISCIIPKRGDEELGIDEKSCWTWC